MDRASPAWLWRPSLIVFLSSACIMALEIVAGRILAPYIGVSLFSWTSIIATVLAGISLGNTLGGALADRLASSRFLGLRLLLSGLTSVAILAVNVLNRFIYLESLNAENLPIIAGLALLVVILFLVPCTVLGTISPVVAKLAVSDLSRTGSTLGRIYASGSLGSIAGTFATGFWLIPWLGTRAIIWGASALLLTLGLLFLLGRRWPWTFAWLPLTVGISVLASHQGWLRGPCVRETNYYCIQVREETHGGKPVRVLFLDRLLHSYTSLDDPTHLVYDYEQMYAELTEYLAKRPGPLSALFIGGGGYTFPRYIEAVYPDSELHVVEIDPGVTQVAHGMLGLRGDSGILTTNEDARMFLKRTPTRAYDLVFGDAFNDFSVPYHLTTREFNDRVRSWLADDGYYAVNIIDGPSGAFLRAYAHTLRQTFRHVYLAINVESWRRSSRSTLVLIAGDTPLDLSALEAFDGRDGDAQLARLLLDEGEIDTLLAGGRTVTLTDRYAPVDQMLMPVFLDQVPR